MLHQSRTKADAARERRAAGLLERLNRNNCFYATPFGSNDDWYWLYAAVKSGDPCRIYLLSIWQRHCSAAAAEGSDNDLDQPCTPVCSYHTD